MKWTLNILLVTLLASCGETQQDCTCEGGPTCLETNIMETPPSDLTSLHAAAGTPKVLVHEVFKIYAELGHNTSNDAEVEEDRNEMYEELTNWLGGKDAGSEGNLSTGIKFSDDLNNGIDVKVTIKVISGELLQRTPIASDGKNRYNSLLNYEIEVIDKDSEKAIRKEASCPDLMVKPAPTIGTKKFDGIECGKTNHEFPSLKIPILRTMATAIFRFKLNRCYQAIDND